MAEKTNLFEYTEESIKSLDWREHIRLRPGMYIGKLGDGSSPDDGIYVLVKEVIDNCIDEHTMGYGKQVDLTIEQKSVTVRDYGRGIPLGKVVDVVKGATTSHVRIDIGGSIVTASITNEAVDDLKLAKGKAATAVIKASDVLVAVDD